MAETSDAIALVSGTVRARDGEPLNAADLLARGWIGPRTVEAGRFLGSAWLVVLSKREPRGCVFQTLMGLPQLYYATTRDGWICASHPRRVLDSLAKKEIDEDALPSHFLFRVLPGEKTLWRGVRKIFPGRMLALNGARIDVRTIRDFRAPEPAEAFKGLHRGAVRWIDRQCVGLVEDLARGWRRRGVGVGNLLSGGEDSSLIQIWLQEVVGPVPSFSFAVDTRAFDFEVDYARDASRRLGTEHRMIRIAPEDYLGLLERTVDALEHPVLFNEGAPGFLALAEALADDPEDRVYLAGQGADSLLGVIDLPPVADFELFAKVPLGSTWLRAWARVLRLFGGGQRPSDLLEAAAMLDERKRPGTLDTPRYHIAQAGEVDRAVRCFGEAAVRRAFEERCELERAWIGRTSLVDIAQGIDFLTCGYDLGVTASRLFASRGLELIQFYLDESVIRNVMMFVSGCGYRSGFFSSRVKPLQKKLLYGRGQRALASKAKGGTAFSVDLWTWMRSGVLADRVAAIQRPDFVSRQLIAELRNEPGDFLWNLLTYDLFLERFDLSYSIPSSPEPGSTIRSS